jgi:hypothetical protein
MLKRAKTAALLPPLLNVVLVSAEHEKSRRKCAGKGVIIGLIGHGKREAAWQ